MGVASSSNGRLASLWQKIHSLAQNSLHNSVDVHRLTQSKSGCLIARLLEGIEQAAKAVDVGVAIHGVCTSLVAPSLCCRNQALTLVNPGCDVRHWGDS